MLLGSAVRRSCGAHASHARSQAARVSFSRTPDLIVLRAKRERLPGQAETVLNPNDDAERLLLTLPVAEASKSYSDLDYLAVSSRLFENLSRSDPCMPPFKRHACMRAVTGAPCHSTIGWT